MSELNATFPELNPKRTTLDDYCRQIREELFRYTPIAPSGMATASSESILSPYLSQIKQLYDEGKSIAAIHATIKAGGFDGSYSLLQQHCFKMNPVLLQMKANIKKVKRTDIIGATWSGCNENLTPQDIARIEEAHPIYTEIVTVFSEFRAAYSTKDVFAVQQWCDKYAQCQFPAICSFINGIAADKDAFYNSLKYSYSNGVLEGKVNKLKEVKRTMYGRASYELLRAKLLLAETV
jgi:hypothetical protein